MATTFWSQLLLFSSCDRQTVFSNFSFRVSKFKDGLQYVNQFKRLWRILSGRFVLWPKSAQSKHAGCPQFHKDVRQQHPRIDNTIIHCIAWATDYYNRLWFELTNNAIWKLTAAPDYSTKREWSEPAAQSIGGSKPFSRKVWWKLQPIITGAFGTVTDIHAPDKPQHKWRMGDASHDYGW